MVDVRDYLREKLAERGLSMKEASERIGRNHAYLQQFLERGVPANLPEEARERLAELLGVSPDQLRFASGSAEDLGAVVDFYDRRFNIGYSDQEKDDVVAYLKTL